MKGRQDFRETRLLIGGADGNALKAGSAWGIDHRLGPVPRWDLCWKSFVYLRAIYRGWREEYKEQERAQVREIYSNELILKVQTTDMRRVSTIYNIIILSLHTCRELLIAQVWWCDDGSWSPQSYWKFWQRHFVIGSDWSGPVKREQWHHRLKHDLNNCSVATLKPDQNPSIRYQITSA